MAKPKELSKEVAGPDAWLSWSKSRWLWIWSAPLALALVAWTGPKGEPSRSRDLEWQVVSESPRIYVRDGFLEPQECDFLQAQVSGRLEPAKVVEREENKYDQQVNVRNNQQIWLSYEEERDTPTISDILKRMHRAALFPDGDAEALQIGLYGVDEKYEMHPDSDPKNGVARPATLIVYLNDVEEGGETLFPLSNRSDCTMLWRHGEDGAQKFGIQNCCGRDDLLRVSAKRGRAVLFFNHHEDGSMEPLAEHAACQVKRGVKWIAQRWFRYEPYQRLVHPPDPRFDGLLLFPSLLGHPTTRTLSQKSPSLFTIEEFLSPDECQALIDHEIAKPTDLVRQILHRMDRAVLMPGSSGEALELKSYQPGAGQGFRFENEEEANPRVWTMILYLSGDGTLGERAEGATIFPHGWCQLGLEDCCALAAQRVRQAKQQVHVGMPYLVPPLKGRAVLFRSFTSAGVADPASIHGSCPAGSDGAIVARRWWRRS